MERAAVEEVLRYLIVPSLGLGMGLICLLFYSAVLPQKTRYSFYSSLLFSIKCHERVLFELCIALKMYDFLADP